MKADRQGPISRLVVENVPDLTGTTTPFLFGIPHVEAPLKVSKTDAALKGVGLLYGPPSSVPVRRLSSETSDSGRTSLPFEVPSSSGSHLTVSEVPVVLGSTDALESTEHVTASVVSR